MKKNLAKTLAFACVLGAASTAFAASNPFVDVPANHWSYDSVSKLVKAGIVDGYNDGTFRGDKTITRYEMAQIVAKAMGNESKADAKLKAELTKLEAEYSDELTKLGVRMDAIEKNQPNLKFNGNMLLRYQATDFPNDDAKTDGTAAYYRLRLDGKATVDENTTFNFRYVTRDPMKTTPSKLGLPRCTTTSKFGNEASDDAVAGFDRYNIATKMGDFNVTAGRQALVIGTTNSIVDSGAFSFDGIKLDTNFGQVKAVANYGRLIDRKDIGSVELSTKTGKLNYGAGYFQIKDNASTIDPTKNPLGKDMLKLWYGNATYKFDTDFSMTAEAGQNKADYANSYNKFAYVNAIYGDQVLAKKGDSNFKVAYWNVGANALALDNNMDPDKTTGVLSRSANGLTTLDTAATDTKFIGWQYAYSYAFSKNFTTDLNYVRVNSDSNSQNNYNYYRLNFTTKF